MRSMLLTVLATVATATTLGAQTAERAAPTIEVTRAVVATGIEDREPIGESTTFTADVGTVYFFTEITGDFDETQIHHVWLREGEEIARVPLTVRGPRWRTWSSKRIPPEWSGNWTVRIVLGDDQVLGTVDFTVGN
ncbi:MAG: DUF2914 domain-containing protein [Gemmatimonadota bacterium]|jgi:hypothetical protein